MCPEYVVEGRNLGAVRMTALNRLLELTGIAKQNDASRGMRYGKYVGQRHLGRFVDHEHIYASKCILPGPEPACRTADAAVGAERREEVRIVLRKAKARQI